MRMAKSTRSTKETKITIEVDLDGTGKCQVTTGVGFFDHMLQQLAHHSLIDLNIDAEGDLQIDDHHCVEDVGIVLGETLSSALGDKLGIRRYGFSSLPMDDACVDIALDLSGRSYLVWEINFPSEKIGRFDTALVREFFQAFSLSGRITLHAELRRGFNSHHIAEATFKSVARALRMATEIDPRSDGSIPSTKNVL